MKKFSFFMACAAALVAGLTSCSQDRDPVYQTPTKFVLNEPVMQDEYINLSQAEDATIELVASQPDYGYAATGRYSALVSLTPDFAKSYEVASLGTTGNTPRFQISQFDLSIAICNLMGLKAEDEATATFEYIPVYVKAISRLQNVESSYIESNMVQFNHILPFFAVASPKCIYLVGNVSEWKVSEANAAEIYENWRLWDEVGADGKNTNIYKGSFHIENTTDGGSYTFRFYSQLGDWDVGSIGSQSADSPMEFPDFTGAEGTSFGGKAVSGKGSWCFPNMVAGDYEFTVNMAKEGNWTITVAPTKIEGE
jgi:outer membrane protein susE